MEVFTLSGKIKLDGIDKVNSQLSGLESKFKSAGAKMTSIGKSLSMKITAPFAILGGMAIKTASEYSESMAKMKAVTGATGEQFAELDELAKKLGRTTKFTASEVAEAMSFMGMAGMDVNEIIASLPDTLNLAAAGALDMGQAADIVTNILAGFGMSTDQLGGAVDVLAKAFTSANVDLSMLGQSMKYAAPVAKGFGLSFEETAAIMGSFGNAGIQASMAGTALRGALVQLNDKAEDFGLTIYDAQGRILPMADILEQLEKRGMTAGDMMDLFGQRAGPAMQALLSTGSAALREFTNDLANSGGTAEKIAKTQMEGLHGSLVTLKSAFEGLQLTIVDQLMPILKPFIEKLTDLFRKFSNLPEPVKRIIVILGIVAAVLGPILLILGPLISSIGTIIGLLPVLGVAFAALTGPIGIAIAAIAAIIAIGVLVWKNWDKIKLAAERTWGAIVSFFRNVWHDITGQFKNAWNFIKNIWEGALNFFSSIPGRIGQAFRTVKDIILSPFRAALSGIETAINWLIRQINKIKIEFPDWMPIIGGKKIGFNIPEITLPKFAHGGVIPEPTLLYGLRSKAPYAIAGEAGPEYVSPSGGGIIINISQLVVREEADIDRIARELYRLQQRRTRLAGA